MANIKQNYLNSHKTDNSKKLSLFAKNLKRDYLNKNPNFIIIRKFEKNRKLIKRKLISFSKNLGKICPQNSSGDKYLEIKPNLKKIKKIPKSKQLEKVRYHESNAGGSIHSDGPQLNIPPKYLLMVCIKNAKKGGESIVTNTKEIYNFIKKNKPEHLKNLKKNYFFERRGFKKSKPYVLSKPIFTSEKNFKFRYLKEYILSGYAIKKASLSTKKRMSLEYLDTLLSNKKFQKKYKLNGGDLIILNNHVMAHGRSAFDLDKNCPRSLLRLWVK